MSLPTNQSPLGSNSLNIISPQPNRASTDVRRQSMAKLSSPLAKTPNSSHLTAVYRDRHSSSSTIGTDSNNINNNNNSNSNSNNNSNSNLPNSFNGYSNTPNSRKFTFSLNNSNSVASNIIRSSSPVIESDDDNNSIAQSYGSFIDDPTILKNVSKHLPTDPQNALKLPSGDITRDLYHLSQPNKLRRSKSMSGNEIERRGSMASQMRLPGGFRRDFIQMKKKKFGYTLTQPTFLTKNFLEFLTIYGHFAGEDIEDEDFLACDYDTSSPDKIDEESPLLQQHQQQQQQQNKLNSDSDSHKSSSLKAFFLLLKAFVGTGILFLPKAFSNGGLAFCIILLLLFSILSYYCYLFLSQTTIVTGISSFAELGNKLYGKTLKILILVSIVSAQIGFVAAYTVFTAENLKAFIKNTLNLDYPLYYFVIFETICFAPMSLIRNITKLSLAALLANVFILTGIATIIFYTSKDLILNGPSEIQMFNKDNWSLFIGVAIFAFEGIGLIIPVQQSMRNPEDFPKVLLAVICVCCFLFIGIGCLCYITYGENVQTVVILNLPQDSIAVISIQFFYALAIMLSVPLQILPAIRLMESRIFKRRLSGRIDPKTKIFKNLFRIFVTFITSIIAYLGSSNLDLFVSFIGCIACIPLVYMYPPMLHLKVVAKTKISKGVDIFLTIIGGIALIYTTSQLFT
ncbi:hypothetical protein C6P40_001406 [Pichia californica]|uniref:Amino acid transporter transmembrane domain-containing protein n=1 Tax=Pichia californica TaxID=460514 RepID=A0A9P7BDH6_9ASCO|nr:hypothetical protein C6P42_001578 [[Candida] californica]KAG0688112.1 hypothetical protein C6P40_001406 [[Candida] californica]